MAAPWLECECGEPHVRGCHAHAAVRDADGEKVIINGRLQLRPCEAHAMNGLAVCIAHGGMAPQSRKRARERLLELVDPALARIAKILDNENSSDADALRAAQTVLDRTSETARVSRAEISGPDGAPIQTEDTRRVDLLELLTRDPVKARRLDRVARDLKALPPPASGGEDGAVAADVSESSEATGIA